MPHDAPTTAPAAADPPSAVVVGVDGGTLSGRAVAVRVRDGIPHAVTGEVRAAMRTPRGTPTTRTVHDWFGRGGNDVMQGLRDIRRQASTR